MDIDDDALLTNWVGGVVAVCIDIVAMIDWADFEAEVHSTIMMSLLSRQGRATPVIWLSIDKVMLTDRRSDHECSMLVHLAEILPAGVKVTIIADHGLATASCLTC